MYEHLFYRTPPGECFSEFNKAKALEPNLFDLILLNAVSALARLPFFYIRTKFRLKKLFNYSVSITMQNKFLHACMLSRENSTAN